VRYFSNPEKLWLLLQSLFEGSLTTLELFALSLVLSLPLGFLVSLLSVSRSKTVRGITAGYVLVMRGTPLLLQIMFIYFGLNMLGLHIARFPAAVLSFVINYAAYYSEIFRGGIQSIDQGQREAADMLGLTRAQTTIRIILPQVFKRVLPSVGNEVINLVKDTSLVYAVGISELLRAANSALMRDSDITPLFVAMIFYLVMNLVVTRVLAFTEKRFAYYR